MQDNRIKAFRQRLVRAGFTDVTIFSCDNDEYIVYATDVNYVTHRERMTISKMESLPKLVWFEMEYHEDTI